MIFYSLRTIFKGKKRALYKEALENLLSATRRVMVVANRAWLSRTKSGQVADREERGQFKQILAGAKLVCGRSASLHNSDLWHKTGGRFMSWPNHKGTSEKRHATAAQEVVSDTFY